jgi:hypothetical protein
MKYLKITLILLCINVSVNAQTKGSAWELPKEAENLKNPYPADAAILSEAKINYNTHCTPLPRR